jgi:hypothetical protein
MASLFAEARHPLEPLSTRSVFLPSAIRWITWPIGAACSYPTSFFANSQKPGDLQRLAEYGELATLQDKIEAGLGESFGTDRSPNAHDVAVAIADLVAQSAGSRPDRVVVGPPFGADAINAHTGAVRAQVLEAMGLTWLTRLKVTSEAV